MNITHKNTCPWAHMLQGQECKLACTCSNVPLLEQYTSLYEEQLVERRKSGGLSNEQEAEYVEKFEKIWAAMTTQDHEAVETFLIKRGVQILLGTRPNKP